MELTSRGRPTRNRPLVHLSLAPQTLRRARALADAAGLPLGRLIDDALEGALPARIEALPPQRRAAYDALVAITPDEAA